MSNKVQFINEVEVKKKKTVLEVAKEANVKIKDSCNGKGKCGKCKVKVLEGELSEITKAEKKLLSEKKIKEGYRLACEAEVIGDVKITVE
ncbi:2Fe-2S iron-sulfur cluster-binding protein [Clostridium sp. DL1XJH146]